MYRQHNSPVKFQEYFTQALRNIVPLTNQFSCRFANNFLLSLQSYAFTPVIDKQTGVHSGSATLIDNIFLINQFNGGVSGGNIVSDISGQFSQFCLLPLC